MFGHAFTEGDTHTADLAEKGALAGDFLDHGGLAETHLAKSLTKLGFSVQRTHSTGRPGGEIGEGHTRTLESRIGVHMRGLI
jgi:hypothetical protein